MKDRLKISFILFAGVFLSSAPLLPAQNTGVWATDYTQDTTPPGAAIVTWQHDPGMGLTQYYSSIDQMVSAGTPTLLLDTSPQLGGALDVNANEITGALDLHSTGDVILELGDAAGSNKVSIRDSGGVEVASIDSDGTQAVTNIDTDTLAILDSVDQSHGLSITAESNLTATRELQLTTGDANVPMNLADPAADALMIWDDTAGTWEPATLPTGWTYDGSALVPKAVIQKHAASHTLTASECYGGIYYVTAATVTLTLPAAADGMSLTVISNTANTVIVDADAADLIILDGTALDDGDSIDSPGAAGDLVTLTYYDATGWFAVSNSWTDGGP